MLVNNLTVGVFFFLNKVNSAVTLSCAYYHLDFFLNDPIKVNNLTVVFFLFLNKVNSAVTLSCAYNHLDFFFK